jgi:non-heme chloroperoxidase
VIQNWWRQGIAGGAKVHYDGIKAFSETDFTADLELIEVPTLVMHGDDDQIVAIEDSALLSAKLVKNAILNRLPEVSPRHVYDPFGCDRSRSPRLH